jgi:hypothetical protein
MTKIELVGRLESCLRVNFQNIDNFLHFEGEGDNGHQSFSCNFYQDKWFSFADVKIKKGEDNWFRECLAVDEFGENCIEKLSECIGIGRIIDGLKQQLLSDVKSLVDKTSNSVDSVSASNLKLFMQISKSS